MSNSKPFHAEARGLLLIAFSLLLGLALWTFSPANVAGNRLGLIGHGTAWALYYSLGLTSYLLVGFIAWMGWRDLNGKRIAHLGHKLLYFSFFIASICILLNVCAETGMHFPAALKRGVYRESITLHFPYAHTMTRENLGGVPLYFLYQDVPFANLQHLLSDIGCALTFSITASISFLLMTGIEVVPLLSSLIKRIPGRIGALLKRGLAKVQTLSLPKKKEKEKEKPQFVPEPILPPPPREPEQLTSLTEKVRTLTQLAEKSRDRELKAAKEQPKTVAPPSAAKALIAKLVPGDYTSYSIPPSSILKETKKIDQPTLEKEMRARAGILEETLKSFGIEAKVGDIHSGPTITSFEVHPSVGVKVQKIKALENDIALNLQAQSIRIIAPIPGKAAVGVEVPSLNPQPVGFKELLTAYQKHARKMQVPVLLGKTVSGGDVISDLAKMPHCLIAGATGSGKSVCINTIIMSILMNARPDEVKLLMVDPKKVELSAYTRLPHMIAPVITEPQGAYAALNWLVNEMQRRYDLLKQIGVRNITSFNTRKIDEAAEEALGIKVPKRMHYIVAIIDEFADLMMVSGTDIETPIARIAQMARAVGIHLILATQRPSREVITGLIKANFPTRLTFKVSSRINSQIIVDETGAETLLGNGDMLFLPPGTSNLVRAQGAYISDEEINEVIDYILRQAGPNYEIKSFDQMTDVDLFLHEKDKCKSEGKDPLYDQAFQIVIDTQTASTTFLQRKLKIGYARAASLMDELQEKGVIGPQDGSKPRKILQTTPTLFDVELPE